MRHRRPHTVILRAVCLFNMPKNKKTNAPRGAKPDATSSPHYTRSAAAAEAAARLTPTFASDISNIEVPATSTKQPTPPAPSVTTPENSTILNTIVYESAQDEDPYTELSDSEDEDPDVSWCGMPGEFKTDYRPSKAYDVNVKNGDDFLPDSIRDLCNQIDRAAATIQTALELKKFLTKEGKATIFDACSLIRESANNIKWMKEGTISKIWNKARREAAANRATEPKPRLDTALIQDTISKTVRSEVAEAIKTHLPEVARPSDTVDPVDLKLTIKETVSSVMKEYLPTLKNAARGTTNGPPQPALPYTNDTSVPTFSRSYAAAAAKTSAAPTLTSSATASPPAHQPPAKHRKKTKHAIIVSVPEAKNKDEALSTFKNNVTFKDSPYAPARFVSIADNKFKLEFDELSQLTETLHRIEGKKQVTAEPARQLLPMFILKGIPADFPSDDLIITIKRQNPCIKIALENNSSASLDLSFVKKNRNPALYNAVFKATPDVWQAALALGRLGVDCHKIHVSEHVPLLQCFKCLGFGHTRKSCSDDTNICSYCATVGHEYATCPHKDDPLKNCCANCSKKNLTDLRNRDTKHSATSTTCPIVRSHASRALDKVRYDSNG